MRSNEIHTIQEFITLCQSILAEHPERMSDKEQQALAGDIVVLMANDEYDDEWQKYSQIIDAIEIAVRLDRLDTTGGGWGDIERLVAELEERVENRARGDTE